MKLPVTIVVVYLLSVSPAKAQVETFDLPRLDGVRIDGDFNDWDEEQGFGVEVLLQEEGTFKNAEDHNVHFRAGWNRQGILIHLTVQDDNWVEYSEKNKYYSADVVEVFLAARRGDDDVCQWYITPGMTEEIDEPGVRFRELRRGPTKGLPSDLRVCRERIGSNKYRMEILAPWSSIGTEGVSGTKLAFQIWVNDKDQGSRRKRYMSIFYPAKGASYATNAMHNVRLVDDVTPSLRITSLGEYDMKLFQPFVRLWATPKRAGKVVTVRQGSTILGEGILSGTESPGRSTAKVLLPPAVMGRPYVDLGVFVDGEQVNSVSLPHSEVISSFKDVYDNRVHYREMFKLDEPWANLDDAPNLERHRGLAAAGLNLFEQTPPPSSANDIEVMSTLVEMLRAVDRDEDYFARQRNSLWGYYFCRADGTGQRFSMSIPKDFDPQRSYPLYVNLHGNGGRPLPSKVKARQSDYFQIRPWGRGDISFFGLGEVDVLESIRHVMKWYPIAPNQICLGGHSMGGNATWDLGSKYSNLFACLAPKAGRSGDDYYENFRHLPSLIQHGARDSSQPVDFGRYTVSRLQQLGFPVIYKEFPNDGHGIRNPYPVEEWFIEQRRPTSPDVITYSCDTTKNGQIYWARIRRFIDPHRRANIDARVAQEDGRQSVNLNLQNIEVIELNLDDLPVDRSKTLRVVLEANEIELGAPQAGKATFQLKDGTWQRGSSWNPPTIEKRPYVPGAVGNLYSGEPLLIVFPTEGLEANRHSLEMAARNIVLFGGFGGDMITGRVPIKADKDVTNEDIQHRNLILFGGPMYNTVTRQLADGLPVTVNAARQFVVDGYDPVDVETSSMLLTTFNPQAPKRLVHIIWRDEIPTDKIDRFVRSASYLLLGSSGRNPHNIPDLQISSPTLAMPIRRQFTHGWKWKTPTGTTTIPSEQVLKDGIHVAKLRLMQAKAEADFAIGFGVGPWVSGSSAPKYLDQFRFRNYRMTTFKAKITGKDLKALFVEGVPKFVASYPSMRSVNLQPEKKYVIVAPEAILWTLKSIRTYWTEMVAGPDLDKSDFIFAIYGRDN